MVQYRRLAALFLGIWIGAGILTDVAVTQNFQAVDRFLEVPGSPATSLELNAIGRERARFVLRRNAAEENAWIFVNWERAELALGAFLFMLLLFGDHSRQLMLGLMLVMLAIVAVQHFYLTPRIVELGRDADRISPADPARRAFLMSHGIYSALEILKLCCAAGFAARLAIRSKPDPDRLGREYEPAVTARG